MRALAPGGLALDEDPLQIQPPRPGVQRCQPAGHPQPRGAARLVDVGAQPHHQHRCRAGGLPLCCARDSSPKLPGF